MRRAWFVMLSGIAVAVACQSSPTGNGSGCGGNGGGVLIITANDNHTFTPANATANLGQSICFQNLGTLLHTVTPDSVVPGDSTWVRNYPEQALPPNSPYQFSVGVGDYYYHCKYHGGTLTGMYGVIHVR